MKAIKCDRCGKYYDEDNRYREDVFYIHKCVVKQNEHIDLCDDCLKSLDYWYNNLNTPYAPNIIVYEPDNFISSDVDFVYLINNETKEKIKFVKEEENK